MKKILRLIFLSFILLSLTACGEKKELSQESMYKVLSDKGFSINDFSKQMEDKNIKTVYVANNGDYDIECYIFNKDSDAKDAFNGNVSTFESDSKTKGKKSSKDNYDSYTQKLSDTYNSVTRVGKNLIYASINIEYKNDFISVLKALTKQMNINIKKSPNI